MAPLTGLTISRYRILEHLGGGGIGVFHEAEDTRLKRTVALKALPQPYATDAEAKERFAHDAQAVSSLQQSASITIQAMCLPSGENLATETRKLSDVTWWALPPFIAETKT